LFHTVFFQDPVPGLERLDLIYKSMHVLGCSKEKLSPADDVSTFTKLTAFALQLDLLASKV